MTMVLPLLGNTCWDQVICTGVSPAVPAVLSFAEEKCNAGWGLVSVSPAGRTEGGGVAREKAK